MEFRELGIRRGNFVVSKKRIKELFHDQRVTLRFDESSRIFKRIEGAVFCVHNWGQDEFFINFYDNEKLDNEIKESFEIGMIPKIESFIVSSTKNEELLVKLVNGELIAKRCSL